MNTYYVGSIPVSDELCHYGILGQKWGVRRYQNEDGTLTSAGKERYTQKVLNKEIRKNEITINNAKNTPLNKFGKIKKLNEKLVDRLEKKNKDNEQALKRYEAMSNKEKKITDRLMKLRNTGNSSFKGVTGPLTQRYVDVKLYNQHKNVKEYVGGYVKASLGIAMPIVMIAAAPKIGELYLKRFS